MSAARTPVWTPSPERVARSQLRAFADEVSARHGVPIDGYADLHRWSVQHPEQFWALAWEFLGVVASRDYDEVVDDLARFPGARWFPGAQLNYAENLLRFCGTGPSALDPDSAAIVFRGERLPRRVLSRADLLTAVQRCATALRAAGVEPGDRVAGYLPNIPETVIAFLATAAVGGIWCSAATDIGARVLVDRIGQLEPRVLITADAYEYKGRTFAVQPKVAEAVAEIGSIEQVVVVHHAGDGLVNPALPHAIGWDDFCAVDVPDDFGFEQLPADHPLVVMFSSGTTGKPKCMVQSAGGVLINQLKEQVLHHDTRPGDRMLYITTCSWMMWNWMVSTLGAGATLDLFDGMPSFPDTGAIWRILDEEQVTIFGLSASYVHALMGQGFVPREHASLDSLTELSQTGSALSEAGFRWLYESVKSELYVNSIAGGTDLNGCFCSGHPWGPVYAGEVMAPALAMDIDAVDDQGRPVRDDTGELICRLPSPSMPLSFWDDPDGTRYRESYFDTFPGVWRHGDYVEIHSDTGGITFHGRSDSVLKPSGVRIGTAEIYEQVQKVAAVADSLAIGQDLGDDQRVLLFVVMRPGAELTDEVRAEIVATLRTNASPRHVPAAIIEVPAVPMTLSGKKVESAVTNLVNHRSVTNRDALANPDSLDAYEALVPGLDAARTSHRASGESATPADSRGSG